MKLWPSSSSSDGPSNMNMNLDSSTSTQSNLSPSPPPPFVPPSSVPPSESCPCNSLLIDPDVVTNMVTTTTTAAITTTASDLNTTPPLRFLAGSTAAPSNAPEANRKKLKYNSQKRKKVAEVNVYPSQGDATAPVFKFNSGAASMKFGASSDFEEAVHHNTNSNSNGLANGPANGPANASNEQDPSTVAADMASSDGADSHRPQLSECDGHVSWQPQSTPSTCEFTHIISSYSQKRDSGCKKAEYSDTTVDSHGNSWRLIVYINGNGRASNHHLSLFLQVADAEQLPFGWNKAVSYVLTLEHPTALTTEGETHAHNDNHSQTTSGYAKRNPDKTFKMCPKAIDWGWSQFIASDRILREGYVDPLTDSLTVRASVTVKTSGVDIDPDDAELYLKCAVEEGNAKGVRACLDREASVNCQFKDDLYTPLHTACSMNAGDPGLAPSSASPNSSPVPIPPGSMEVLELLLSRGADVNACNKWRETPLLIAANNGHVDAVRALLRNGADPSLCSEAGWSALTFAAHKGYDDIVSALLDAGAPVNCRVTEDLSTPLHKACAGSKPGHLSAVHMLLEGDADVHALNKWRETPLLTAANHGQSETVEALLEYGADPCKCTDTGWSPLSIAAYKGHDEVCRLLLEEGAPTEEDDPTLSALLQAATKGLPETVILLLEHGADHTVTTKKGDTALAILVEQNMIDAAVEMVTDYNASIPRCSRDRKKVQRARLLINLRLKQMQRDGTGPYCEEESDGGESDEGESDVERENGSAPLHQASDGRAVSPSSIDGILTSKKKKGKKQGKSIAKAEADARAAEEALLLELEEEEKERTAATEAKSAKKKKQKEKERLLREAEKAKEEAVAKLKEQEQQQNGRLSEASSSSSSPAKKEVVIEQSLDTSAAKSIPARDESSASTDDAHASVLWNPSLGDETEKQSGKSKVQKKKDVYPPVKNAIEPAKIREVTKRQMKDSTLPSQNGSKVGDSRLRKSRETTSAPSSLPKSEAVKKILPVKSVPAPSKKIPGDNPKKIPGDNPSSKKMPGEYIPPRRIPGDNPVLKKSSGDNPKVPVQQYRQNLQPSMATAKPLSPSKPKRGWENRADKSTSTSESAVGQQRSRLQQSPVATNMISLAKDTKRLVFSKESRVGVNKSYPGNPKEFSSPSAKVKARSDESTHSTANSTADSLPPFPTENHILPQKVAITPRTGRTPENDLVVDQLANMANDVLGFLDFDAQPAPLHHENFQLDPPISAPTAQHSSAPSPVASRSAFFMPPMSIELPSVSIFRLEKLNDLFRLCSEARSSSSNPLRVINEHTLRVVIYRWLIRASHGVEPFLDPVIPSWEDGEFLREFLQRQFISESRRSTDDNRYSMNVPSIEVLRDAGAAMSEICLSLAREVSLFRLKCEQRVSSNWSDADINISGVEDGRDVIIDWSGKSRLSIPFSLFNSMARRYVGEQNRLMAAVFSAVRRYEIIAAIVDHTNMVCHLPPHTIESLSKGLLANLETWSDSVSVHGDNSFCTMFPDVDTAFGGLASFAKENGGGESVLLAGGGSVIVVAPPENATASQCIRKVIDMVENSPSNPLSFSVVLSSDCFVNASAKLSVEDLNTLDPRLCGGQTKVISYFEEIPPGVSSLSTTSSIFMLIQNEPGQRRFPLHASVLDSIRCTMRRDLIIMNDVTLSPSFSVLSSDPRFESSTFPSIPQPPYSIQENPFATNPFAVAGGTNGDGGNRGRGHRGRLFDLVGEEDVEEDQGMSILPGMLDSLNVEDMFGNMNASEDIDIEAISLMGIGLGGALNRYNQS